MNISIVTLFNEKAEPAELHFLGFGVGKTSPVRSSGTRVRTQSLGFDAAHLMSASFLEEESLLMLCQWATGM